MTLATILGWLGIACVTAALFGMVMRSQPKSRISVLPRCECGDCARTRAVARSAR